MLRALPRCALLLALAACGGGDDATTPPATDAGPDATPADAGPDAGPFEGQYDSPAAFPHDGCVPGSMAGFHATGIYRNPADDAASAYLNFVLRAGAGGGLEGRLDFWPFQPFVPVRLDDDHLFVRALIPESSGHVFADTLQVVDLCARDADGTLHGHTITCEGGCPAEASQVTLRPMQRRAGEATSQGLSLVSSFFGNPDAPWDPTAETYQVRVRDGLAYVARDDGLHIVDVHDPATPNELARAGTYMNDLKVYDTPAGRRIVAAATDSGATFFDVTDPLAPVSLGSGEWNTRGGHDVFIETVAGRIRLYLVDGWTEVLDVLDVTDPAHAFLLGTYVYPGHIAFGMHDLFVEDGVAYVNNTTGGLLVLDVHDLSNIQVIADEMQSDQYSHASWLAHVNGRRVLAHGDEGTGAHLRLVDVEPGSPTFLQTLGSYETRPETSIHNFMAVGTRVYIAYYEDGVRVVDIADPTQPRQIAYYNTFDFDPTNAASWLYEGAFSLDVDPATQLVYLADSVRGLVVLREEL
jgi:hypothetical protein